MKIEQISPLNEGRCDEFHWRWMFDFFDCMALPAGRQVEQLLSDSEIALMRISVISLKRNTRKNVCLRLIYIHTYTNLHRNHKVLMVSSYFKAPREINPLKTADSQCRVRFIYLH